MTLRTAKAAAAAAIVFMLLAPGAAASGAKLEPVGPVPKLYPRPAGLAGFSLTKLEAFQEKALAHYKGVVKVYLDWRKQARQSDDAVLYGVLVESPVYAVEHLRCRALNIITTPNICWHAHAARWTARELEQTRAKIRASQRPAHMGGWICIHGREGAWNSQTGNGFYGGLQMTYGWMGLVSNAALLSPLQQMMAAETGYRLSGYSHAWLAGQWPNTYPPCAGYF